MDDIETLIYILRNEKQMDFTHLNEVKFVDLVPGNKYYIQGLKYNEDHPGTGQQYGIFDRYYLCENESVYAVFPKVYDFKNPYTNEYMTSCMAIGDYEAYRSKYHFLFYEPTRITYSRKQNEFLGKVMENIVIDAYMCEYITKQGWLGVK